MSVLPLVAFLAAARADDLRINFEVTGLVVNAAKPGGAAWDVGGRSVAVKRLAKLATMAAGGEAAMTTVVGELASVIAGSVVAPDPRVEVELLEAGEVIRRDVLPVQNDTFQPTWSGRLYQDVPVRKTLSVRLTVVDADLEVHDPIGVMVFPTEALLAAARKGGVVWAPVVDQTRGSVLFAGVTAWIVPRASPAGQSGGR